MSVNYPETTQSIKEYMKEVFEREKLTVVELFHFVLFGLGKGWLFAIFGWL